jgi:hypothetical protein
MTARALLLASTALTGSLAGMELASWAVVHPAVGRLEDLEQVHTEKALYRRFGQAQAPQMAATVTITTIIAATADRATRPLAAAAGCLTAMLALTLAGNMPVNLVVLHGQEQEPGDRTRWRTLRRRWDRIHTVRVCSTPPALASSSPHDRTLTATAPKTSERSRGSAERSAHDAGGRYAVTVWSVSATPSSGAGQGAADAASDEFATLGRRATAVVEQLRDADWDTLTADWDEPMREGLPTERLATTVREARTPFRCAGCGESAQPRPIILRLRPA